MEAPLNIYAKLQNARVELQKRKIKKTGYNKYAGFRYYELSDFLPNVNEIFQKLGPKLSVWRKVDIEDYIKNGGAHE